MFRSLGYSLKQAMTQVVRNKSMILTSLFSITAMLLILGLFFIMAVNVNLMTENAKNQFDMVEVYITDETRDGDIMTIINDIKGLDYIDTIEYLTKEDAMAEMQERWGENAYLLEGLSENPLPRSIRVTLQNIEDSQALVDYVSGYEGIERVEYDKSIVDRIVKITDTIQIGALIIIAFLIVVSIVVVSNTIKLTVLARGREISIMKYVGATNWFIRGPFLVEGMIIGIIAALISSGIVCGLYYLFTENLSQQMLVLFSTGLVPLSFLGVNIIVIFMAIGISIGTMGSMISMRRFLDT